jgi:membrane-associated phospholipid phosphatase
MPRRASLTIEKFVLTALVMAVFLGGYFLVGRYTLGRARPFPLIFTWERELPLLPWMVFPYLLALVLPDYALFGWPDADKRGLRRQALCYGVMHLICFAIFLAFPVKAELRPALLPTDSASFRALAYYYEIDPPVNLFPSLHCANAVLAARMAQKLSRRGGWLIAVGAALVVISVVLVKQHYVADAVAGVLLALGIDWLLGPPPPAKVSRSHRRGPG